MQEYHHATPAQPANAPAVSHSTSMTTATSFIQPSAAAITNHPVAITAPHANTSTIIRNIVITVHTIILTVPTVILSEAKDLFTVISTKRSAWRNLPVMPDLIRHPQASSLRTSSHHHQPPTTSYHI